MDGLFTKRTLLNERYAGSPEFFYHDCYGNS